MERVKNDNIKKILETPMAYNPKPIPPPDEKRRMRDLLQVKKKEPDRGKV